MLTRTVGSTVTKYVYGLGLISEETNNTVKVYHFDYRGSTVAVTSSIGATTDLFTYDTYGKITSKVGNSGIIFCYNGRDGVVTDTNGLFYMRARYYSPDMRRFVNADILHGKISDSTSLNRYSYVNGNPVSFVDPFGLNRDEAIEKKGFWDSVTSWFSDAVDTVSGWIDGAIEAVSGWWTEITNWVDESIVQPVIFFVEDIKEDFDNYDLNNTSELDVLRSNYFSSYKGQFVIRFDDKLTNGRPGSFIIMFLGKSERSEQTVKHEYGHFVQLNKLGLRKYIQYVVIPSINSGDVPYIKYYSLPFERSADILGGVERKNYNYTDGGKGETFIEDIINKDVENIKSFFNMFIEFFYKCNVRCNLPF